MALLTFNPHEARTVAALCERIFPATEDALGANEIGVVAYIDLALAGAYADRIESYRLGLQALDRTARARHGLLFADCDLAQQDGLIGDMERGVLPNWLLPDQRAFFETVRAHTQEGLFADPAYGGNRDKLGWKTLGHPGIWLENSAEENLTPEPVTKGGVVQSLADVGYTLGGVPAPPDAIPGYDPQRGLAPPTDDADVVLVGVGSVGSLIAPLLAQAGLKVVAFEPGPWRTKSDFLPDELGAAYYCRANMGPKFLSEVPRWRRNAGDPEQEATFSLGRMMNSVGGSVIHYGAWLRRFHPYHFALRSHIEGRWGLGVLPKGCTLADWPISYADLEPYFGLVERIAGVAGNEHNPFVPRSTPFPMPPLRPFRLGEVFSAATRTMGLHPHAVPVGMNSIPYDGRPATTYTAWSNGFGSYTGDKWHPDMLLPAALANGNLDLRTHCRVVRLLTDRDGHADGVEYIAPDGSRRIQRARTVILAAYTFENVRLLLLSGDATHSQGLGNNRGQVGQHFMTKMFAHVDGYFPDMVFNRHTGPAAQGVVLDDFLADSFDPTPHGFVGGATLGAEQQFLPIQISREALPLDTPRWGRGYKEHIRQWQHFGVVRIQPDTLSYRSNFLDLAPQGRDRSGLGLPLVRITYDMRENEQRLADWMEGKAEQILRAMGAVKTWRGPRFTGVGSSHDLGGCRMGHDPGASVVDADLQVHDTPGLYVFSGATFPTCPGINPTLTLWAVMYRAAERLVGRLRRS